LDLRYLRNLRRMVWVREAQVYWDPASYKHQEVTEVIIQAFYEVYNELGHGFLESVYEQAMNRVLRDKGVEVKRQSPLPVWFRDEQIGDFRADLIVANSVIVELKAARALGSAHEAQLLNCLRASDVEVGLLLNFGPGPQVKRMAFANQKKKNLRGSAVVCGQQGEKR
jgi:GxxExxY protein